MNLKTFGNNHIFFAKTITMKNATASDNNIMVTLEITATTKI